MLSIKEGSGVAANVLKSLEIDLRKIRLEVEKIVQSGPKLVTTGKLPQTPRAKKVIEYAIEEARNFNHNYVGTEHLLLGLVREWEGVASQVLMNLGLRLEDIREEVLITLGHSQVPEDWNWRRLLRARKGEVNSVANEEVGGKDSAEAANDVSANDERIRSLELQLWNTRVVLGALVGAIAGTFLFAQFGAVMGLLLGGLVAALGWRTLGVLAGGTVGTLLGCSHLLSDGGGFAGALLGALVGLLISEIGPRREKSS
jgi:hypothetical protein